MTCKYGRKIFFSFIAILFCTPLQLNALSPDGIHEFRDYCDLSAESPVFDAACAVLESQSGVSMSGVLISPQVVLTAAHGIEAVFRKIPEAILESNNISLIPMNDMFVVFSKKALKDTSFVKQKINVKYIVLDVRYFQGNNIRAREGKFDFALLILERSPTGIEPAVIFKQAEVPDTAIMTVVTHGMSDLAFFNDPVRRAFRLYERDTYYDGSKDPDDLKLSRSLQESSLYFKPSAALVRPPETEDEAAIRSYDATQNWILDGKKPYALALPGTSGSPVFVRIPINGEDKLCLFGIVSSFSHISGVFTKSIPALEASYIQSNVSTSLNQYLTIFSLPYKRVLDLAGNPKAKIYERDSILVDLLFAANQIAHVEPFYAEQKDHYPQSKSFTTANSRHMSFFREQLLRYMPMLAKWL